MDLSILPFSLLCSSFGVFVDAYSTSVFVKDLGLEFEANPRARRLMAENGPVARFLVEVLFILIFSLSDVFMVGFILSSLFYGVTRGLVGLGNFRSIARYRLLGIARAKEDAKILGERYPTSSHMQKLGFLSLPATLLLLSFIPVVVVQDVAVRSISVGLALYYIADIWYGRPKARV